MLATEGKSHSGNTSLDAKERRAKEELGKKTSGLMPGPNFHDVWPDVISEDGAVTRETFTS